MIPNNYCVIHPHGIKFIILLSHYSWLLINNVQKTRVRVRNQFFLFHVTYILRKNELLLDHFMAVKKPLKREITSQLKSI